MAIEFDCPACDATIRVGDNAAGKKGRCPKCKTLLLVPDPGPEEDEPEPAPDAAQTPEAPEFEESVFDTGGSTSTDTLPVGPGAGWTPPSDTMPLDTASRQEEQDEQEQAAHDEPPVPDEPVVQPVAPVVESEFSFIPGPASPVLRTARRRQSSSRPLVSAIVAIAGLLIVMAVGWYVYRSSGPDLSGTLTADRLQMIGLEPATFAPPTKGVPKDDVDAVLHAFSRDGLPLRSEYIDVLLTADGRQIQVFVDPGPRSDPVRLPLGEHAGVQAALRRNRQRIADLKQQELQQATADLFRDYTDFLQDGSAIRRLPEYRNQVALNAAVGTIGYAVEAVAGGYPFPCVYEDGVGNCYFFLPAGTTSFRLRGRELADGSTPLAVDFEVQVVNENESNQPPQHAPAEESEDESIAPPEQDQSKPSTTEPADDAPAPGGPS